MSELLHQQMGAFSEPSTNTILFFLILFKEESKLHNFAFPISELQEKYINKWDKIFPNFFREKPPLQEGDILAREPHDVATVVHTRYF